MKNITLISLWRSEDIIARKNLSMLSLWLKKNKNINMRYLIFYDRPLHLKWEASRYPFLQFWRLPPVSYSSSLRLFKAIYSKTKDDILIFLPKDILIFPRDILHLANSITENKKLAVFLKPLLKQKEEKRTESKRRRRKLSNIISGYYKNEQERLYDSIYKNTFFSAADIFALNIRMLEKLYTQLTLKEKKFMAKTTRKYMKNSILDYKFLLSYLADKFSMQITAIKSYKSRMYYRGFPVFFVYRQIFVLLKHSIYFKTKIPSLSHRHFFIPLIQFTQITLIYNLVHGGANVFYILPLLMAFVFPHFYQNLPLKNPFRVMGIFFIRFFVYLFA